MLGVAAVVGIGGGVTYYLYSLSYESTDDAFIDGHVVAVSPRVAGHVAKVYVTDNQWVNQGDLLAELDPRDFEARLAAAEAALSAARAGQKSRSIGADVTEITSTAGVDEASAAVEGARAAVETARAAVATAKSQQAQAQAQLAAVQAGREAGPSRPRGRGSQTTAGRRLLETHCGAGSRTCRFPGHPGGSGCRANGSPPPTFRRCGSGSRRKRRPSGRPKPR